MRFEDRSAALLRRVDTAFELAADETVEDARRRAPRKTGKWADSIRRTATRRDQGGRLVSTMGSPLVSALAHERGAYIQAKRAPYLVFRASGSVRKVNAVRIPARPAIGPAGRTFRRRFVGYARIGGGL